MHWTSFPKHPPKHFSDVQRISKNYLRILVIVVTIKFIEK
jgi:hypothetical protein